MTGYDALIAAAVPVLRAKPDGIYTVVALSGLRESLNETRTTGRAYKVRSVATAQAVRLATLLDGRAYLIVRFKGCMWVLTPTADGGVEVNHSRPWIESAGSFARMAA